MSVKCLVFDLDDTLADSKQPVCMVMIEELCRLSLKYDIAIISGCKYGQMEKQVVNKIPENIDVAFDKMHFLPTSGAEYYLEYRWVYRNSLTDTEKAMIFKVAWSCIEKHLIPKEVFGPIAEDRGSQITFSMCGQHAPIDKKKDWNKRFEWDRNDTAELIQRFLPSFTVRVGGTTSIDITKKGIDKGFGVTEFMKAAGFKKEELVFFGDQLQPGGNDHAVKELGIKCIEVTCFDDTLKLLKDY